MLRPFKDVTCAVSAEKCVTISLVHPLKTKLLTHLNDVMLTSTVVKAARTAVLDDLAAR